MLFSLISRILQKPFPRSSALLLVSAVHSFFPRVYNISTVSVQLCDGAKLWSIGLYSDHICHTFLLHSSFRQMYIYIIMCAWHDVLVYIQFYSASNVHLYMCAWHTMLFCIQQYSVVISSKQIENKNLFQSFIKVMLN